MSVQEKYNDIFPDRLRKLIEARGTTITAVSKELGIGAEYVSVSVEDVEKERWEESMRKIPAGTVFVEPGAPKGPDGTKGGEQI